MASARRDRAVPCNHGRKEAQRTRFFQATTTLPRFSGVVPSEQRRQYIEAHAAELIPEEMLMCGLRQAYLLAHERIGNYLGTGQESVSSLEKRRDSLISTLSSHVEAMGGSLPLVAKFAYRPPVALTGLVAMKLQRQRAGMNVTTRQVTKRRKIFVAARAMNKPVGYMWVPS